MPSNADNSASSRASFGLSIARIFLVETLVLLALAAAFVAYLNWSSGVAWEEFLAASKLAAPAPNSPVQAVKGKTACDRRV